MAKRKRKNRLRRLSLGTIGGIAAIFFFAGSLYLFSLYHVITEKFESHRWNLPSRVYSSAFPLYPGLYLDPRDLDARLDRLGYYPVNHAPDSHGQYRKHDSRFEIYLHRFAYPHGSFPGFPIGFDLGGQGITAITRLDTQESLAHTELEPELIASIFDDKREDRTVVRLADLPPHLVDAVVAIEDARFYSHIGIDPVGIVRAMLANIKAGGIRQGGSTITQQMVKNFFLDARRTLGRKLKEAMMAVMIEARYSKTDILDVYLNDIYLGQRGSASVAGMGEAARYYFSKDIDQLSLAEAAFLAGLIRSPGTYSPSRHPQAATERRNLVLAKLRDADKLSLAEYQAAIATPLRVRTPAAATAQSAAYFVDYVIDDLRTNFPREMLVKDGLRIFTTLDMSAQLKAEAIVSRGIDKLEKTYSWLAKNRQAGLELEGALLSLQPQTGFIHTYVGGRQYGRNQFDHIRSAHRQPGSAFKPFVYATALMPHDTETPFTLASRVSDEKLSLPAGGSSWTPENYDHRFHGWVSLRTALEHSYNVASVWLATEVGLDAIITTATRAGITSTLEPYPSLALGAFEVTPLELATAYTVFPNDGVRAQPVAVLQVITADGTVLDRRHMALTTVLEPNVAYLMNRLLMGVLDEGTAASARALGFTGLAAGKTGTTSDYRDAWFVGYTPERLTLTWVGYDHNTPTRLTGGKAALPLWAEFMTWATRGKTYSDFTPPEDIIIVTIDTATGLLPDPSCGPSRDEYFLSGTEPTQSCLTATNTVDRRGLAE